MSRLFVFLGIFFLTQLVLTAPRVKFGKNSACNDKVMKEIIYSANAKCDSKAESLSISQKEVDFGSNGALTGAFSFKCNSGEKYLGIIKVTPDLSCATVGPSISHTSEVPASIIR